MAVGGYDDMSGLIESGDIVPLLVFCEHRLSIFPDCECAADVGIESYSRSVARHLQKQAPRRARSSTLVAAIEECRQDPSWQEFLHNAAYDERTVPPWATSSRIGKSEYKSLRDYMFAEETLEKDYEDLK